MTDSFTSTLKELLEKATKGPWVNHVAYPTVICAPNGLQLFRCYQDSSGRNDPEANAALICTLVNAAPEILEMMRVMDGINKIASRSVEAEVYTAEDALLDISKVRMASLLALKNINGGAS